MAFSNRASRFLKGGLQLDSHFEGYYCLAPATACRFASGLSKGVKRVRDQPKSKKKTRTDFINQSLKDAQQFSLCDAMRYDLEMLESRAILC